MSQARIAAHPLVVAMAFGLLGPAALADDDTEAPAPLIDDAELGALPDVPSAIDPDDFARVEREWLAVRGIF